MNHQKHIDFARIQKAIEYIDTHFEDQPNLDEVAGIVHMSPFHFQKLFSEWAGTSPKKYLQYTTLEYTKKLLREERGSLEKTGINVGLSGTGRLHDLFVTIECMAPGEYKNGGESLTIHYTFAYTLFGQIIIASTIRGVCYLAFIAESISESLTILKMHFPHATYEEKKDSFQERALSFFKKGTPEKLKLHLKGTDFQLRVWRALLLVPEGHLSTYGAIAEYTGNPKASRAVGTAIGGNPIAYIIPCHRVIQSTGMIGGYHWGSTIKKAIIGWEGASKHENR